MNAHLLVAPILLPLLAAASMLLLGARSIGWKRGLGTASVLGQLALAGYLLQAADAGAITVYLVGNWPAQLGIAFALDRLSALMLLTTAALGVAGLVYASAGWDLRAPRFHPLFQALLMGLNGAFLTADLFNLFVFFEVLLIASYGLLLSGGRGARMRAGLHYVAFNIAASTLYLIAVGLLYGLLGALNLGEMALRIASAPAENHALIAAAGGLLLLVFAAKAALFPLYLWLPQTYSRTPAPVLALFAVMTKLGVYAVLRVYSVLFGSEAGALAGFAWGWLLPAAGLGLGLAAIGALAAKRLRTLVAYLVIASAATLFIAVALDDTEALAAGLYYLPHSSFAAASLFLLADLVRRQRRQAGDSLQRIDRLRTPALLGGLFLVAAIAQIGLPPLSGFIAKAGLLAAIDGPEAGWLWPLLLVSSLLALVALAQAGSQLFWRTPNASTPTPEAFPPRRRELAAVLWLLGLGIALTLTAGPALDYTGATARQVRDAEAYRDALLSAPVRAAAGETP